MIPTVYSQLVPVRNFSCVVFKVQSRVMIAASDILHHLLAERGITPGSYRETFKLAAEQGLIPADLAIRLQDAAGMRNVIVHLYEQINYTILRDSIAPALEDFRQFVALFEAELGDEIP